MKCIKEKCKAKASKRGLRVYASAKYRRYRCAKGHWFQVKVEEQLT